MWSSTVSPAPGTGTIASIEAVPLASTVSPRANSTGNASACSSSVVGTKSSTATIAVSPGAMTSSGESTGRAQPVGGVTDAAPDTGSVPAFVTASVTMVFVFG